MFLMKNTYKIMKSKKKKWSKPKLHNLNIKKSKGGDHGAFYEDTMYIPGQGGMS